LSYTEQHRRGIVLHVLKQKQSTLLSSSSMVTIEMETGQNAEQRVKHCTNQRHYSHAHHRPPQQQYKSKNWTIAIILKLAFVAWDSWTYQIGY